MSDANRTQMLSPGGPTANPTAAFDPNKTMMGSVATINATVTIKPVQCPVCRTFNPVGVMFCVECGLIFDRALPADAFGAPAVQLPILLESNGREHPLRAGTTVIGREGDLMLIDTKISRRHAQITHQDGVLTLEDLGSSNGTKVDGTAVVQGQPVILKSGQKVSFAGTELTVQIPGAGGSSANTTQAFGGNKTAAISVPPTKDSAPATLIWGDQEFALHSGINTFGRKSENAICIPDPYMSGKHGQIELTESGLFITDLGSTNGTLLNDAKLSPNMRTQMNPEDTIRIGSIELHIQMKSNSAL